MNPVQSGVNNDEGFVEVRTSQSSLNSSKSSNFYLSQLHCTGIYVSSKGTLSWDKMSHLSADFSSEMTSIIPH